MTIQVSTKVCSFGKQVVEKLETEFAKPDPSGRFIYKIQRSPMCEYMINFIHKLKHLPEKYMMNSVLENFTILQVSSILRIIDTYTAIPPDMLCHLFEHCLWHIWSKGYCQLFGSTLICGLGLLEGPVLTTFSLTIFLYFNLTKKDYQKMVSIQKRIVGKELYMKF